MTHRYQHIDLHEDVAALAVWSESMGLPIVAIDNVAGAVPIEQTELPASCVLLFGQEGPGLSDAALDASSMICEITQYGSTRSLNAGVASGVAMFRWVTQHGGRR